MLTPPPLPERALRVRRAASLCLSASSLALTLLTAIPLALVVFGSDAIDVPDGALGFVLPSQTLAIAAGATGLVLAGNLPLSGVARRRFPVQLGVAALLTVGACTVMMSMPVLLTVASYLAGLLTTLLTTL